MHADSQVPSLGCGRAQGAVICTTTAVEEEFWPVTPAISLSVFWAWVNCRVLKWINLVTLKPFFYKTRKWIWLSHPNQQESCIHCRTVSLLKMRTVAVASQRQDTNALSRGSLLSLPAYIWQSRTSTSFFINAKATSVHVLGLDSDWYSQQFHLKDIQTKLLWPCFI